MKAALLAGAVLALSAGFAFAGQSADAPPPPADASAAPAPPSGGPGGGRGAAFAAVRQACAADAAKLCPDAAEGRERMRCLRSHQDDLSDSCKTAWAQARANWSQHGGGGGPGGPGGGPPPGGGAGN